MTVSDSGWGDLPKPSSKLNFLGNDAIEKLVKDFSFNAVLDVGCGEGNHAQYFKDHGKAVTTLDAGHYHAFRPDILGMYEDIELDRKFDCIWMSHILEHVRNIGLFLEKVHSDLSDNGILAVTVPPLKHDLVSGHLNLFNPGTLVYHLIQAGFDCSKASVKVYGYNISVIVQKDPTGPKIEPGTWSFADVARLFPFAVRQNSNGRVLIANW